MHFADDVSSSVGQRLFNVVLTGQQVLTNFDVYLTAGKLNFKAVVKEFTTTVSSTGEIEIDFNPVNGKNAVLSGLEFIPQ